MKILSWIGFTVITILLLAAACLWIFAITVMPFYGVYEPLLGTVGGAILFACIIGFVNAIKNL